MLILVYYQRLFCFLVFIVANENPLLAIYASGTMSKPLHPHMYIIILYYMNLFNGICVNFLAQPWKPQGGSFATPWGWGFVNWVIALCWAVRRNFCTANHCTISTDNAKYWFKYVPFAIVFDRFGTSMYTYHYISPIVPINSFLLLVFPILLYLILSF